MKIRHPNVARPALPVFLSVGWLGWFAAPSGFAATYYWDGNGEAAGFGAAAGQWTAPTVGSATQGWSTVAAGDVLPSDTTTTAGDTLNFGTAASGLASGTVTVSGTVEANALLFGTASGAVTLSGGTIALGGTAPQIAFNNNGNIIASPLTLGGDTSVVLGSATALVSSFNGPIGGNGKLTFTTPNTTFNNANQVVNLGAAGSYAGETLVTTGNLNNRLLVKNTSGAANVLPTTTVLTLDGGVGSGTGRNLYYDLNGQDQTLAGLKSVSRSLRNQRIDNTGAAATLKIDNSADCTFGGAVTTGSSTTRARIQGALSLVKAGTGTFTLAESHTYSGNTTVNAGKLRGKLPGSFAGSGLVLAEAGACFSVQVTDNTKSWTVGAFAPTSAGTLEFDFGAVTPGNTVSPLIVATGSGGTGVADFTAATPLVRVLVDNALLPGTYPLMTWNSALGTPPGTAQLTVSNVAGGTAASLSVTDNTLNLVIVSTAITNVKANNAENLNLGTSWVGGKVPGAEAAARWDATVTSANTTVLGADLEWLSLIIANPAGPVTIGAGNSLTLGGAALDIDMTNATTDLTLGCGMVLSAANVWDVASGRTLEVAGAISGVGGIAKQGEGKAILSGASTYAGDTEVGAGLLQLGGANVVPNGSGAGDLSVGGTLDLNGFSEGINGLNGAGTVDNLAIGTTATLSVGDNDASSTFAGVLQNTGGTLNLVKTGAGVVALGGQNTMSGSVTVDGGTLQLDHITAFADATGISLGAGATLRPKLTGTVISVPVILGPSGTDSTITAPLFPDNNTGASTPKTIDLQSGISGDGNLTLLGVNSFNQYGTIILSAPSTYKGSTLMTTTSSINNANIFVNLNSENALPVTTVLTLDGGNGTGGGRFCQLDLKGYSQTLAGLSNVSGRSLRTQRIINTDNGVTSVLTVNNTEDFTYSGQIGNGGINVALTKSGPGALTLGGTNAYTGATMIKGGTLALGASNVLADATEVSLGAATLAIGAGFSDTLGALDPTAAATINLGAAAALAFADSSAVDWSGGTLTINGSFVSGASLRFGTDASGLTPAQLSAISGPGLSDIGINSEGYITATVTSGYNVWAITRAGGQAAGLDFDLDGVTNGAEYFMNAPDGFTTNPQPNAANTITWPNGGNIPASAYGTRFVVQTSTNLLNWTDVPIGDLTSNTDGPGGSLSYTLTGAAPRFARLVVNPE